MACDARAKNGATIGPCNPILSREPEVRLVERAVVDSVWPGRSSARRAQGQVLDRDRRKCSSATRTILRPRRFRGNVS